MPQFNLTDQELNDLADFLRVDQQHQYAGLAAERGRLSRRRTARQETSR